MASPVNPLRAVGLFDGVAAAGNDRQGPFVLDLLANLLAVIGFISGNDIRCARRLQNLFDDLAVVNVAASEDEVQRTALAVDDRVDFCAPAAAADADRLILLPPFAPLAARWAFTMVLSIKYRLSRDCDASLSKIFFQMPRRDQRLKRLYAVV